MDYPRACKNKRAMQYHLNEWMRDWDLVAHNTKSRGDYHDALHNKRSTVIVNLVEATGGLSPPSAGRLWRQARRAGVKGARDGTRYGTLRISPKSFVVHHTQRISKAAVIGDARNIKEQIRARKSQALYMYAQQRSPRGV